MGNSGVKTGAPSGNSGSPPLLAMIFLSVSASSSEAPPGSWGASLSDGGGGILRSSKLLGKGGKRKPLGGTGGMIVGVVGWEGVLTVGDDGVWGGGGAVAAVNGGREG